MKLLKNLWLKTAILEVLSADGFHHGYHLELVAWTHLTPVFYLAYGTFYTMELAFKNWMISVDSKSEESVKSFSVVMAIVSSERESDFRSIVMMSPYLGIS